MLIAINPTLYPIPPQKHFQKVYTGVCLPKLLAKDTVSFCGKQNDELLSITPKEIFEIIDKTIKIKIEEEIFNDKEIIPYIIAFNDAQEDYNFVLTHFKNDEKRVNESRNKLIEAKRNMDSLDKIKKYNELYEIIVKDTLYLEMSLKEILKNGEKKEC